MPVDNVTSSTIAIKANLEALRAGPPKARDNEQDAPRAERDAQAKARQAVEQPVKTEQTSRLERENNTANRAPTTKANQAISQDEVLKTAAEVLGNIIDVET